MSQLHPRNRQQGRYNFAQLIQAEPALAPFMLTNPYGKPSINFADPQAVRVFNRALLKQLYGLSYWDIPENYLCPPVPGRGDYVHNLADLLVEDGLELKAQQGCKVLDIGTGANCIYPLLGHLDYGWRMVGADIDRQALASAQHIVQQNQLQAAIELRLQTDPKQLFTGVIQGDERFALTLCNPPFHSSAAEAASGSRRKWKNLGKQAPERQLPTLNFGGQSNELWCPGGEVAFVRRMLRESQRYGQQVAWFTSLLSKQDNVRQAKRELEKLSGVAEIKVLNMSQGQKISRFIAWSFQPTEQRRTYLKSLAQA